MAATERYLRLTRLAQRAFSKARLERALRLFVAAENEASRLGDRELTDRAFCNRCVVLLELERLDGAVGELKHVLMRSRDPFTAWMAAYYHRAGPLKQQFLKGWRRRYRQTENNAV